MNSPARPSLLLLSLLLSPIPAGAQAWEALGESLSEKGISESPGTVSSRTPSVAVDMNGRPGVAWSWENYSTVYVYFKHWSATEEKWVAAGTSASSSGVSKGTAQAGALPVLAYDKTSPVIAWSHTYTGKKKIWLRRFDGSQWVGIAKSDEKDGISGLTSSDSREPSLAVSSSGAIYVAWSERSAGAKGIHLKMWAPNGTTWNEIGGSATGGGLSASTFKSEPREPSLALDPAGNPVVSWIDTLGGGTQVYLKRWDPERNEWIGLAGSDDIQGLSATTGADAFTPRVQVNGAGRPIVAWRHKSQADPTTNGIHVRFWNPVSRTWEARNGSASGNGISGALAEKQDVTSPTLMVKGNGDPVVAWTRSDLGGIPSFKIQLRFCNSAEGAWQTLGGSDGLITPLDDCEYPSGAIDPLSGTLYVAWDVWHYAFGNSDASEDIYLAQWKNQAPLIETLGQFRLDGTTPIPHGGLTMGETGFIASATVNDPDGDPAQFQVELHEIGKPVSGVATASGPLSHSKTPSLTLGNLALDKRYHWRARAVDAYHPDAAWIALGKDAIDETDVYTRTNADPVAQSIAQYGSDGKPIGPGGNTFSTEPLIIKGAATDADIDAVCLHVEIQPLGKPYLNVPTATSAFASSGAVASVEVIPAEGLFKWQAWFEDQYGGTSDLQGYGGNSENAPDFVGLPKGSVGGGVCDSSASGSATWLPAVFLLLAGMMFLRPR